MEKLKDYLLIGIFAATIGTGTYYYTKTKEFKTITTYSSLITEFIYKGGLPQLFYGKESTHDWIKKNILDIEERLKKVQTEEEYHKIWDTFWKYF